MSTSSAKNNRDEGHKVRSRRRITSSMRGDAAAAWRDRDLPSRSRSFLGGDQMSRARPG
jgi:hypothetical protein